MTSTTQPVKPAPPDADESYLTLQDACELLPSRPSYSTVLRWTKEGRLPSQYRGGRRLIHVDELARFARLYGQERSFRQNLRQRRGDSGNATSCQYPRRYLTSPGGHVTCANRQ